MGDLLTQATYGTTGYVETERDLIEAERVIGHNLPVLRRFSHVAVATNYHPDAAADLRRGYHAMWRRHVPECTLIDSGHNRGHSIGTADLENLLWAHCRSHGQRWLCKGANDVLLDPAVFDIRVTPADFYFLNAVSYDALVQHGLNLSLFVDGFFFPQTTFYVIDTCAGDDLYDEAALDAAWHQVTAIPDYNGRIWEYLPGWSCERLLRDSVLRNGLRRCHLMSDEQWRRVLDIVVAKRISDCSFKGLSINGICHGQGLIDPALATVV